MIKQYIEDLQYISATGNSGKILSVEILVTASCNFKCSYCFEGEKPEESIFKIDDYFEDITTLINDLLNDDFVSSEYEIIQIDFWGGEPTINQKFLIRLIEYYKENSKIIYHLYSNGYKYTKFLKYLEAQKSWLINKLEIQISYDGKVIHDKFRLAKNNKLTADAVMENIIKVADVGYRISLKSTLPLTAFQHLYTVWEEFKDLNKKGYNFQYAPTIDYYTLFLDKTDYLKIFETEMLKILRAEVEYKKIYGKHILSWLKTPIRHLGCSAGANMLIVDNNGDIFPCHGCLYIINKDKVKICNIRDKDYLNKIKSTMFKFIEDIAELTKCVGCPATHCAICNSISYDKSNKISNSEKWFDYKSQNNICEYYKLFGMMHRAILED